MMRKVTQDELPRDELEAAIEARRELGQELEPHVIDGFVERIEKRIDARVDTRLAQRGRGSKGDDKERDASLGMALGSMGLGIPLSAIAGGIAGPPGLLIAWVGIVLVNVAYAFGRRLR